MSEENKNILDDSENDRNEQEFANNQNDANTDFATDSSAENKDADTLYFTDESQDEQNKNNNSNDDVKPKKEKRKISVKAFVISLIAVLVASVMLTYSICSSIYQSLYAKAYVDANKNSFVNGNVTSTGIDELDIIAKIINDNYYGDVNREALMEAAIQAYVKQTGDVYAAYYTPAELKAQQQEDVGNSVGVGINIINTTIIYQGVETKVLKVVNVTKDSPAEKAGIKIGDYVYAAVINGEEQLVNTLGYDETLNKLLGEEGSTASFIVFRGTAEPFERIPFDIVREKIITQSVYYRIPEINENKDGKIGVIKITKFDYTTPTQFCEAIEALKANGCDKFVIDVRNNPGGYQSSIGAVLSYFLNEGDVYIRTKDKAGNETRDTVRVVSEFEGPYAGCNVTKEDIGKYKGLKITVLCNEYTASAGELFVATFKDYELGTVVGNTTFGKGKLQSTYYLENYALFNYGIVGIDGAIKITTHEYFSAKSESYDGIGIEPNEKVQLSEEAMKYNVYDYKNLDPIDDQLLKAVNILNG